MPESSTLNPLVNAASALQDAGANEHVPPIEVLLAEPLGQHALNRLNTLPRQEAKVTSLESVITSPEELTQSIIQKMKGKVTDLLVVRGNCQVNKDFINALTEAELPKYVLRAGTGMDNLDTDTLDQAGIGYGNTPSVNTESAAELAIGMLFAASRGLGMADQRVKSGNWSRTSMTGIELRGKTLGVVGYGRIGQTVARTAAAIGMKVNVLAPRNPAHRPENQQPPVDFLDLDELTKKADFLTIHIPLTEQTRHMIGQAQLDNMSGRNAVIVNTARGGIVDEKVLLKKLTDGSIYAAGIDVFEQEGGPIGSVSDQLSKHPKVVAAPHIGGQTIEASQKMADEVVNKARQMFAQRLAEATHGRASTIH